MFYTINVNLNMEIDHNWFHNAYGRGDLKKAAGIYLDNDPGKVKIHHNVIYDTEWSSIQMNWDADDIDIFNNTLWDASAAFGAWHLTGTSFSDVRIWNNLQNNDIEEAQADKQNNLILEENANPFTSEATLDFSLVNGAAAIDFGREIDGFTDGFKGLLRMPGPTNLVQSAGSLALIGISSEVPQSSVMTSRANAVLSSPCLQTTWKREKHERLKSILSYDGPPVFQRPEDPQYSPHLRYER